MVQYIWLNEADRRSDPVVEASQIGELMHGGLQSLGMSPCKIAIASSLCRYIPYILFRSPNELRFHSPRQRTRNRNTHGRTKTTLMDIEGITTPTYLPVPARPRQRPSNVLHR
jgi:hypothetical protein